MSSSALNEDFNRGEAGSDALPDLVELAAAIARISALFAGDAGHGFDPSAAIERIADIAFVLHERDVEPSLCDALDAAVREISQADAARQSSALRTQQAIALLGEVSRRIAAMAAQAQAAEADALRPVAEPEQPSFGATAERPGGSSNALADDRAAAAADEPRSPPAVDRPPEPPAPATGEAEPASAQSRPVEGGADAALPVAGVVVAEPPASSASASDDPLAAVRALSEEEKIALFS